MRKLAKSGGKKKKRLSTKRNYILEAVKALEKARISRRGAKRGLCKARRIPRERWISNTEEREAAALCYGWGEDQRKSAQGTQSKRLIDFMVTLLVRPWRSAPRQTGDGEGNEFMETEAMEMDEDEEQLRPLSFLHAETRSSSQGALVTDQKRGL